LDRFLDDPMSHTPPGRTRERIYRFVRERLAGGRAPTVREVQEAFSFRAVESARAQLEALVAEGRLAKEAGARWKNVGELAVALRPFGPLGIIDISIERIIGVLQQASTQAGSTNIGERRPSWPPISSKSGVVERHRETTPLPVMPAGSQPLPLAAEAARAPTKPAATIGLSDTDAEAAQLARLGGARKIPKPAVDQGKVVALKLDHRAGFVLSLVDGSSSIDDILDVSGMPRRDALRILCELVDRGAIKL